MKTKFRELDKVN